MTFLDNIEQIITLYPLLAFGAVFFSWFTFASFTLCSGKNPLVVRFVGGYSDGDKGKAFRYSLVFVIGLSLTFTAFGAATGLLGTMFGTLGSPWYLIAGIIALVICGQLMGLYEINLPIKCDFKPKQDGIVGAFLLGLFFGVTSSPCATPVLVVLLTFVAGKGQVLYGIALLFCYAIDQCLLMLFAGTFTGFVEGFVKARGVVNFSLWAKRVSGLIVALVGDWFVWKGL
jgi:cytochrome c biogenesis protein CcdA